MRVPAKRILIVLLGAIGDVARALPLANRVRAGYPTAHLAWAVEPAAAPVLAGHPALDARLVFERAGGAAAFVAFLRRVRAEGFDLALDLQRHAKSGLVSAATRAPVRLGFHRRNAKELNWLWNTHTIAPVEARGWKLAEYERFADWLELPAQAPRFEVTLAAGETASVDRLLAPLGRPFAALFLGSTWESRRWFADRCAGVIDGLAARGLAAVLVGGADVRALAAATVARAARPPLDLTARTSLRETYGILARARIAIGPDSGPMHLAAAAGTPVVSLWGATTPARSAPFGSQDLVLVGRVPCAPCYLRRCPIGRACMADITTERVLAQVGRVLDGAR
ncbi:MAG: glycosyltransferase family 9 protein [Deltaproteobacteria bacterium]|nr:glycosyltransferase family 9 protein [Deltaproteobacteria bacterium]